MPYKTIFIANLAEIARPLTQFMSSPRRRYEIEEDRALCDRFVFSGGDDRILITPYPLDKNFLLDSLKLLKFKNVVNLSPRSVGESLCESILKDNQLLKDIVSTIRANRGIRLISYAATPEFLELIKYLKKRGLEFETPEVPAENDWTTAFFDSKSGFRQTVGRLGRNFPPMPEGFICVDPAEVVGVSNRLIGQSKDIVLKANRGLAGAGLKIVRRSKTPSTDIINYIKNLVQGEPWFRKGTTVVEEFIESEISVGGGAPNVELRISEKGVEVLYVCGMRVSHEGVFRGVELGLGALPKKIETAIVKAAKTFGQYLGRFGYRGYFEIDFVYGHVIPLGGKRDRLYALEANLRRTGGTHVFELGQRLLGRNFVKNYYLTANNMNPAKKFKGQGYSQVKAVVRDLFYPINGQKEGVIITITSLLKRADLGYVVIGPDRQRAYRIEQNFLKLLN